MLDRTQGRRSLAHKLNAWERDLQVGPPDITHGRQPEVQIQMQITTFVVLLRGSGRNLASTERERDPSELRKSLDMSSITADHSCMGLQK